MAERGVIHIITELGGCVIGLPTDKEQIASSLRDYARCQGMERLELLDPSAGDLGEWANMATFAITKHGIEDPVLVGTHRGDRVLLGVRKLYGYPAPGVRLPPGFLRVKYRA